MALDAIQTPLSLYEPVFSEGGDTLYVMDQISDKKTAKITGSKILRCAKQSQGFRSVNAT